MSTQDPPADTTETPAPAPHALSRPALALAIIAACVPVGIFLVNLTAGSGKMSAGTAGKLIGSLQLISIALALIALGVGIAGVVEVRKQPGRFGGQTQSIIAVCLSAVVLCFWALAIFVFLPMAQRQLNKARELTALRMIGIAMVAYSDENVGHAATVPTLLVNYLYADGYQEVMQGSLNPSPSPLPTKDDQLPADIAPYAAMKAEEIPVGAYRFGGYWLVVHGRFNKIKAPTEELLAFSRRFDKNQEGRGVLMVDTSARWVTEAEFRTLLEAVNVKRTARGMKAIVVDD